MFNSSPLWEEERYNIRREVEPKGLSTNLLLKKDYNKSYRIYTRFLRVHFLLQLLHEGQGTSAVVELWRVAVQIGFLFLSTNAF